MKVQKDHVVAVSYELHVDGKLADKAASEAPLEYIHGTGMLLPKFEASLDGKLPGDDFAFTLTPEEGYGTYNPAHLVKLPMAAFQIDGKTLTEFLVPGRVLPMLNSAGQVVQGTVVKVEEDSVTMDFNHPMAGKTLNFTGRVESVRKATDKELKEGLHGEYLPPEEDGCCHKGKGGCHKKEGEGCCHEGEAHEGCCHEGEGCGCKE
ncbi:MAG: peptidylprolyl isomerase [Bacteroidales bacterium]|nr:peptidylprolyl isomerase [Bacteroidales bacterium]